MAVNIGGGGYMGVAEPVADAHAVNTVKEQHTRLHVLECARVDVGQAGKGEGYERWGKIFNIKEAAKMLNFFTDNGLTDYGELAARAGEAGQKFDAASAHIKQIEACPSELRMHIISYSKTRAVYAAFRKAKDKKIPLRT